MEAVEPIIGMPFRAGDGEHQNVGIELQKHERIREAREQGPPDVQIRGRVRESGKGPWAGFLPDSGFSQV